METLGARTRQTTRRSKRAGVGEAREEEEAVRVARPRQARSSPRRNAPEEEEVQSATPSSSPRPRRSLRNKGVNARDRKGEEFEERAAAVQSAPRRSGRHSRGEKQESLSTLSRRSRSTGRRNRRGEDGEVRGSRPGRPERSPGHNAPLGQEDMLVQNAPGEDEAEARMTYTPGAKPSSRKYTREEEEEVWGTRSLGRDQGRTRMRHAPKTPAGDKIPVGPSGCVGEKEPVRRSPRPAPVRSEDSGNYALDTSDQGAVPSISGRGETPPAASYRKESGEEEGREEDEDCNMLRQLLRLKDQIKQQLLEYKVEVEASKESPIEELTEDGLLQRIDDLERKMEGVKIELEMKTLALKRVQVAHALQKKLEKEDSESKSILAILKNILALNSSILKAQQKTRDLEEKILEVKKKRLMYKKAGEEKLLEIQAENKKKKDELNLMKNSALTKMKKSLQKEIDTTTIIQNVFQHLIMAAKIDWAADPALKDLILQLEKNLSFI
ncbi:centromere protein H isoform X1 [Petaurus breviceps papuanus]|uniref:centromere protein H isoform X1 n=1 Tax=Petaurus breviceps papuanus TaxID=3040969 RepID=UPI0036DF2173